jgi:hypothetical protein
VAILVSAESDSYRHGERLRRRWNAFAYLEKPEGGTVDASHSERKPIMRPRLATLPYPVEDPRQKEDTQPFDLVQETVPFDLSRVKPSDAPGAGALAVKPHLPPRRAKVAVGGLPSVVIDDAPDLGSRPRRR